MSPQPHGRRLALVLEYDGSRYGGSQLQKRTPSIQGELETAIEKLTGERSRAALAGRTDAGVHALGQVAAFTTASSLATEVFVRGLNAWLPEDIAVRRAIEAPPDFDPRRHASGRTYRYGIYNGPVRSPLWRGHAWHVVQALDITMMQRAAQTLVGEHDFAAFSRREGVTTVRCIRRCEVTRKGALVSVEVDANAFLRQQMRRTVGALVQIGAGKVSAAAFRRLLSQAEPATAGPVAPAHGLCLVRVAYPGLDLTGQASYD
ncbi:MAG: tRNA pseudouridine(38-40) synthase TruA [Dehalococcoidia bacterium]